MKDDIKIQPNSQSQQFSEPAASPPKTVDGITPPPQGSPAQKRPNEPNQPDEIIHQESSDQVQQLSQENQKTAQQEQPAVPKKSSKKSSLLPIIMAVIVLLALSSLAVYAGLIKKDEPSQPANGNASTTQQAETQKAEDNQAVQETIDQINDLPEEQDSSGDNLSDNHLGL